MPREIRNLADEVLHDPHVVELASRRRPTHRARAAPGAENRKRELLEHILTRRRCESAIVFTRTKHRRGGWPSSSASRPPRRGLQGNMSQGQRDRAMRGFRKRRYDVLVATDIAARGIDVSGVSHVINFDVPNTPEAYTRASSQAGPTRRSRGKIWRRGWDSNPRTLARQRFSRPPPSTARPPLREEKRAVRAYLGPGLSSNSVVYPANDGEPTRNTKGPLAPEFSAARRGPFQCLKLGTRNTRRSNRGDVTSGACSGWMEGSRASATVGEGEGARRKAKRLVELAWTRLELPRFGPNSADGKQQALDCHAPPMCSQNRR